jgi:hypothetical protein
MAKLESVQLILSYRHCQSQTKTRTAPRMDQVGAHKKPPNDKIIQTRLSVFDKPPCYSEVSLKITTVTQQPPKGKKWIIKN